MMRLALASLVALVLVAARQAGTSDKVELRYKFKKGEKVSVKISHGLSIKLDEVPEAFQGLVGESPFNLKLDGVLNLEVKEVSENGKARLEGEWRTFKAKGNIMVNEVDYAYDSEKKPKDKGEKKPDPTEEDPALAFGDPEEQLHKLATQPVVMTLDPLGRFQLVGASDPGLGGVPSQFLSFNGILGPLPEQKVGRGESWKSEENLAMPGMGAPLEIKLKGDHTYQGEEKVGDQSCIVIATKVAVGGEAADPKKKKKAEQLLNLKMKTTGEGEGKTYFNAADGLPAKAEHHVSIRIKATVPDPNGGEDIEIKATLKMDQSQEFKRP